MLIRFSLYGFLKNQQYYDYFLILAFIQMGLSYFMIGLLIAFREIMINIMEVPTGAIADLFGRRKSMILSFVSYIISFLIFGIAGTLAANNGMGQYALLFSLLLAMLFFAIGDAFRTGTHKAMIFRWLSLQGRDLEATRVYGYTRSWSKIGSAVSVIFASIFVYTFSNFIYVFFFAIIPYILNIINFLGYPKELDGEIGDKFSLKEVLKHLKETIISSLNSASLRRLLLESMGFEGFFKVSKDYLQPILKAAAIPLTALLLTGLDLTQEQSSVVLIGPIFFVLFILSAIASRNAHHLVRAPGAEDKTAILIWLLAAIIFLALTPAAWFGIHWGMILMFIILYMVQNFWRPVLISRFNAHCEESRSATVLSLESQVKSLSTMIFAPIIGLAVDIARNNNMGVSEFWPIGVFGLIIALAFLLSARRNGKKSSECVL